MFLINFGHPFTSEHLTRVEGLSRQKIERVIAVPVQFDNGRAFLLQLQELLARVPLSTEQWQTEAILVNLPSLNFIAALLLAELHGRMGYFPSILRMRPVEGSTPTRYEAAEILNLEAVRAAARQTRF